MRAVLVLFFCIAASCGSRPCSEETTACGCFARSGSSLVGGASECRLVTDSCWCPSECDTNVRCICGGGRFVRCEALTDAGN